MTGRGQRHRFLLPLLTATALLLCSPGSSLAATLRVAPVTLQLTAPAATSSIRVWNDSDTPMDVQIRVFRWVQRDGEDVLEPTDAVAVSPPIATLQPGAENIVRVVRIADAPVAGEEAYRLLVDQLPTGAGAGGLGVNIVVRHSIPVFFDTPALAPSQLAWSVTRSEGGYLVSVHNTGATRAKIADIVLADITGQSLAGRDGLVGYALAGSTMQWLIEASEWLPPGSLVTIDADGEAGPIHASVRLQGD